MAWPGLRSGAAVLPAAQASAEVLVDYPGTSVPIGHTFTPGVMDGTHRIARAVLEGMAKVSAVRFPFLPEPDYRHVQPDQLPH